MVNLTDVLIGIFQHYSEETFENDREKIHTAFYNLRNEYDLFDEITFRKHFLFPRSKVLDYTLYSLQPAFIRQKNFHEAYVLNKSNLKKAWNETIPESLKQRESELIEIAEKFKEYMGK